MHKDSIEPGIASEFASISPKGGSIGQVSTERLTGDLYKRLKELESIVNDLRKRVKALEEKDIAPTEEEFDKVKLIAELDDRYFVKNGSLQTVFSQAIFNGQLTITKSPNFPYGWKIEFTPSIFKVTQSGVDKGLEL